MASIWADESWLAGDWNLGWEEIGILAEGRLESWLWADSNLGCGQIGILAGGRLESWLWGATIHYDSLRFTTIHYDSLRIHYGFTTDSLRFAMNRLLLNDRR